MTFDNHDSRIAYYELLLKRDALEDLPQYELPMGYRFVFYEPGDRDAWIAIEKSAKEFETYEQGLESWNRYYAGKDEELTKRMVFVLDEQGEKVATATAFYDIYGRDTSGAGWLHWVAVKREYQGRGLSKPLIGYVLRVMRDLGYSHAKIPTQTTTWLACKIYLDFGFVPIPENAVHSRDGWRIVRMLTEHPTLAEFEKVSEEEVCGVTIREASAKDSLAIANISRNDLGYDCSEALVKSKLSKLQGERETVLVAASGQDIAGYIHMELYELLYEEPLGNVLGLAVRGSRRREGIGRALLEAAEEWARSKGAVGVRLNSGGTRTGAHAFYRAAGYDDEKAQLRFAKRF